MQGFDISWNDEDLGHARRLVEHLRRGGARQPIPSPVALGDGEVAVSGFPWCLVGAFAGTEVEYRTWYNPVPHPVGMAMNLLVHCR